MCRRLMELIIEIFRSVQNVNLRMVNMATIKLTLKVQNINLTTFEGNFVFLINFGLDDD